MSPSPLDARGDRYCRQSQFHGLGEEGQRRIEAGSVLICGAGALGSVLANTLARAGVGRLRIIDRDFLELNNLQRQVLYDEPDVADHLPKAIAAAAHLRQINSSIAVEPIVADVNFRNVAEFVAGMQVIADGTDNFETRFLLNDAAHRFGVPWVYGGCIGAEGQTMTILPGQTACLRCLMPTIPPPGSTPTCDTAGIIGPIVNIVASLQAAEVLKILSGNMDAVSQQLSVIDVWENRTRRIELASLKSPTCPTCGTADFTWLDGQHATYSAVLCGRQSVQLTFPDQPPPSFDVLESKWAQLGSITRNRFLLRATLEDHVITIFADGRAVIGGTDDPSVAKSIYARFVGR